MPAPVDRRPTTIVTIDGPAGAGKSTVAKAVAKRLKFAYLDTGAMYRSVTLKAMRTGVNLEDEQALVDMLRETTIDFGVGEDDSLKVFLDGEDVSEQIRTPEVTDKTFYAARLPRVREVMVQRQREIGQAKDIVVEGRDTGTVVFTQATKKFYLDADFAERVKRRLNELRQKGIAVKDEQLKNDLRARDHKDFTRQVGPLKKADDAVVIDSTHLSVDEVVEAIVRHLSENSKP